MLFRFTLLLLAAHAVLADPLGDAIADAVRHPRTAESHLAIARSLKTRAGNFLSRLTKRERAASSDRSAWDRAQRLLARGRRAALRAALAVDGGGASLPALQRMDLLRDLGRHAETVRLASQALATAEGRDGGGGAVHRRLGWALFDLGRPEEAVQAFATRPEGWKYFPLRGSVNAARGGRDIEVAYSDELLCGGQHLCFDYLREISSSVGRAERCADVFAGAGFIGFALLAYNLCGSLVVVDRGAEQVAALRATVARMRARGQHGLAARVTVARADVLDGVPAPADPAAGGWDLVVGYPPDIAVLDRALFPDSEMALIAFNPGHVLHRRLYAALPRYLAPGGRACIMEAGTDLVPGSGVAPGDAYRPLLPPALSFLRTAPVRANPIFHAHAEEGRNYYFWTQMRGDDEEEGGAAALPAVDAVEAFASPGGPACTFSYERGNGMRLVVECGGDEHDEGEGGGARRQMLRIGTRDTYG